MRNTLFKFGTFCSVMIQVSALFWALTLTCCTKDDGAATSGTLVGKWLLTAEWDGEKSPTGKIVGEYDYYDPEESCYIIFHEDGTGESYEAKNPQSIDHFGYSYDSGKKILTFTSGEGFSEYPATIEKLTATELIMTWSDYDDGWTDISKSIFKRVD